MAGRVVGVGTCEGWEVPCSQPVSKSGLMQAEQWSETLSKRYNLKGRLCNSPWS